MWLRRTIAMPLFLLVLSIFGFVAGSVRAGTYRVVLDECKKRTGLGETICQSLVKNNLTIESCQDKAGLSETECAKRIEEIKNDPEFKGEKKSVPASPVTPVPTKSSQPTTRPSLNLAPTVVRYDDPMGRLRSRKELSLSELAERTESMISFLRSQGVDTTTIEAAFPEFETRAAALLSAYDTYRAAHLGTAQDKNSVKVAIREDARRAVSAARDAFVDHYRNAILLPIRIARDQIK